MAATDYETPLVDLVIEDAVDPLKDTAPKSSGRGTKAEPKTPAYRQGVIAKGFTKIYGTVGLAVFAFDQHCGQAILESAEGMANSLDTLAKDNPAVRRVLSRMITTSAWSEVIVAHAPLVMAIAGHHVPVIRELLGSPKDSTE